MNLLDIQPHVVSSSLVDKIFLFYGEPGSRKTSVGALFPNSLLAAFEIGYKFIEGAVAQPITSWADFKRFVRLLNNPQVKQKYDTIVIDTVSLAYSACENQILANLNIGHPGEVAFGKAYDMIRKEFEKTVLAIPQMGYGLVLIAHAAEGAENDSVIAKIDLSKRPAAIIKGLADFIFYTRKEYRDGSENRPEDETVYAYSGETLSIETKSRSRYFAPKFEFTYENLVKELEKAVAKQKEVEGTEYSATTKNEMLHAVEKRKLDDIKAEITELGKKLTAVAEAEVVRIIQSSMPEGVKISEATEAHRATLEFVLEELIALSDSIGLDEEA